MSSSKKPSSKVSVGGVQYVLIEGSADSTTGSTAVKTDPDMIKKARRDVLIRQPSYCKILDDLKGTEATIAKADVSTSDQEPAAVQTITINGQQYQIVSPSGGVVDSASSVVTASSSSSSSSGPSVVQYAATSQNGQTVFLPGTLAAAGSMIAVSSPPNAASGSSNGSATGDEPEVSRKREIRLMKNREAARECRNKKKEYIKCLENRVAVLENQNKALIEELKSLKELYTGQQKN